MNKIIFVGLLTLILVIFFGNKYQDEIQKENKEDYLVFAEKVKNKQEELKEQKAKEVEGYGDFYKMLYLNEVKSIKFIGDSITAGVGTESHYYDENGKILFDSGQEIFRESAFTAHSWANMFRNYVSDSRFGNIEVTNSGIGGKTTKWVLENVDYLINENEDVVFVMLGTNDRTISTIEQYKTNIEKLLKIIDERSKYMVVMSPPPSSNDYYKFNFSPEEIDAVLKDVVKQNNYNFISHFDGINLFLNRNEDVAYEDLMQTEGAHPIEKGYEVMWQTIRNELELQ